MSESELDGFQIQPAIDKVIGELGDTDRSRPVAIVAAFPAHFPLLAGEPSAFVRALKGLLTLLISSTKRDEVRLRVQLVPAGLPPIPGKQPPSGSPDPGGPWGLISVSDREGSFAPGSPILEQGEPIDRGEGREGLDYQEYERQIEAMGGMLWTEQPEPSATTIWVALPLKGAARSAPDVSFVREAVGSHLQDGQSGKTILFLTDDDSLSEFLVQELTSAGYRVVVCQAAIDFTGVARREQPDLAILDLQAREPSAFELARLLKQDPRLSPIPVLFLTTIPDPEGGYRMDTARFLVRSEGTGAMLTTIQTVLSSGVPPAERVLIVEPDEALREQMIMHVQAHGHPVVEAGSAEEALALVERTRIGVILANASTAQARDYWLIRQVKSVASGIKVYILSDSLSDRDGREAILRGAAGFGDTGRLPELLDKMKGEDQEPKGA